MAGGVRAAQACRRKADLAVHLASTDRRFSGASGLSWSATRSTWPLPPPLTTTAEPSRRRRWPSTACASLSARFQLGRRRTGRGHRAQSRQPGQPSRAAACPPPRSLTSLRPDTADAGTHGQRTPIGDRTPNTGDRPADTWTLRRPHRTLDTGRVDRQAWTLVAGTGHWTPDAGRGRGQGDDGTAGIQTSWTTTPGDRALGRPTVFLWTGPAGLGSPCRLGRRSPAGARLPLALPCSARPLRRH